MNIYGPHKISTQSKNRPEKLLPYFNLIKGVTWNTIQTTSHMSHLHRCSRRLFLVIYGLNFY